MQGTSCDWLAVDMSAEKLAAAVLYEPVALPPEATKPLSSLFTPNVPAMKLTLVADTPDHLTTRLRLSLPTFDAKVAHELVPTTVSVAVALAIVTEVPLETHPPKVMGLIVLFSGDVPCGSSGGLKVIVAARLEQLTVPFAVVADAVPVVDKLTSSPRGNPAATTKAANFLRVGT